MTPDTFTMNRYPTRPPFASFLPGIAGEWGIPVWCYYSNRGQGVCSFGAQDKDHPIMEFSPAHVAYQTVGRTGFRTFIKYCRAQGREQAIEAFADDTARMDIRMNSLSLRWENEALSVSVTYFVLPGCKVGALARKVLVQNLTEGPLFLDALDGMPAVVCAGVNQDALKNMAQLAKAWMQVEDRENRTPFYRVRYSMADTATVHEISNGHFAYGFTEGGEALPVVVDPEAVFAYDTAFARPLGFWGDGFEEALSRQADSNLFPCALFRWQGELKAGETAAVYELFGAADSKEIYHRFMAERPLDGEWFSKKEAEAQALTEKLTRVILGRTADARFDAYARQSYLDNLLRGGEPIRFSQGDKQNIFYAYSRKHGDMEREYNYFVMSPEHFSQGNGNFRDVCQNRRSDVKFHPWVGEESIRLFFSLVQTDGYNPLVIDRMTFRLPEERKEAFLSQAPEATRDALAAVLSSEFTPGQLARAAEESRAMGEEEARAWVESVLAAAQSEPNAAFGEGYWSDHWTYSLDLIENYLAVWPEKKRALLFGKPDYPWYETRALILPLAKRRDTFQGKTRQVHYLDMERKKNVSHAWAREGLGQGKTALSTLMEKIILLCAVKYAALDPQGMGVSMEGGKPGWYDALNGLPGLFGSSVAESCELKRLMDFAIGALLEEKDASVSLYREMAELLFALPDADWEKRTELLEAYRLNTCDGVQGEKTPVSARQAAEALQRMSDAVGAGLRRAIGLAGGICPTYFMFAPDLEGPLPLFLEGPVRYFKLNVPQAEKRAMADRIRRSGLYDEALGMYKVNEDLSDLTFEAGRCKAFTRGWLENESVWLHMEYKYLLELLRSGLYAEYEEAVDTALIPFLNPETYGRSIYENVSFIASSANPNPAFHGRGFVARLSGSTAEFLSMWQEMMFGKAPFAVREGQLTLELTPMLPKRLIPDTGLVEAMFLGQCLVTYHISRTGSLIPGQYRIDRYVLDGKAYPGPALPDPAARAVRDGQVREMDVYIG